MQRKANGYVMILWFVTFFASILCFGSTGICRSVETALQLPDDIALFLRAYEKAVKEGDLAGIMSHYSDRFRSNDRNKNDTEKFWSLLLRRSPVSDFRIQLNRCERDGDLAEVDGTVFFNHRPRPLQLKTIIREDGHWRWYGRPVREITKIELNLSFADPKWNGVRIPDGQQCRRFGGNPFTPVLSVENIPEGADALIMEFSDRDWPPMDNGGHGRIGYMVAPHTKEAVIPEVAGHTFDLPEGFFLVEAHRGAEWDKAGAYMPPCSGGRGNRYYITVLAVKRAAAPNAEDQVLAKGLLEMGVY